MRIKNLRGVSEVRFKKLDSFTLETSKNHLIRNFLRNGRLMVNIKTCVTHAVSPRDDARYYSFPFEFEFEHSENTKSGDLIVEAVSYGFFGNRRIEGYGYAAIPQKTGNHLVTIPCWRPKQGIYEE